MTFYCEASSPDEGHYLAAVLNSTCLNERIKESQPRGLFGERHIQRLPFEFAIPAFEPGHPQHQKLVELGKECQEKVASALPDLLGQYSGSGPLRVKLRELLAPQLKTIDRIVKQLL